MRMTSSAVVVPSVLDENVETVDFETSCDVVAISCFNVPSGPLSGLLSRAVVIIDETGKVIYTEQVPEIAQEPNYEAALAALS